MIKEYIKIQLSDLIPNSRNPRKNDGAVEAVSKSIKETGYITPIVIDEKNQILCGHTRAKSLKKLGNEEIEVLKVTGLTNEQKKRYSILDNKTGEVADWDFEILQEDFDIDDLIDLGFDIKDLDQGEVIEDEAPPIPETPKTVKGDVYELNGHRVMCGDSTILSDVEKLMDGQKSDLFITDPPYNVGYQGKTKDKLTIQNDKIDNDSFRIFLKDAFHSADMFMKEGAVFYIWHADLEGYNFRGACNDISWKIRQCLIWNKDSMVMGRQDYHWQHEPCLYGWKDGASHLWASDRKQTTILNFERPKSSKEHPTMKPIALYAYQLQNNTKGQDIVLDLFCGSGTAVLACEQTNRKCYGMELDEKYCDVIVQRWVNFTKQTKIKRNGIDIEWPTNNQETTKNA